MESSSTENSVQAFSERVLANIATVMVGRTESCRLALAAMLAGGHVLLDDVPGTGKTLLAKSLARSCGVTFSRVQFTPDLLPSDLTGIQVFDPKTGKFSFRPGPVFTNILLADEINRAAPRTQSSLLECMEEKQVTAGGTTHVLPSPYFVIATQNPVESQGTFPLPDAQLDRFMLRLHMGYPDTDEALRILHRFMRADPFETLEPVCSGKEITEAARHIREIYVSEPVLRYLNAIIEKTRTHADIALGVSPRGTLALMRCAQALTAMAGRTFVTPEDIKSLAVPALAHRLVLHDAFSAGRDGTETVISEILASVPVPTEAWDR